MCVAQMDGWARIEGFWGAPRAGNIVALVGRAGRVDSSHPQDRDSGASLPADRPEGGVWGAVNRIRVRRAGRAGGGAKRGRRVPLRRRHPANRNAPSAELHGCCRCARERGLSPTQCPPDGQPAGTGAAGVTLRGERGRQRWAAHLGNPTARDRVRAVCRPVQAVSQARDAAGCTVTPAGGVRCSRERVAEARAPSAKEPCRWGGRGAAVRAAPGPSDYV